MGLFGRFRTRPGREGPPHRVVIVGGGFGGLRAARRLHRPDVDLTLIDRRNFHLFQPLLYQVATGGLSSGDIAYPLRAALRGRSNARVLLGEVVDLDPSRREVYLEDTVVPYDTLVVAAGSTSNYFGHEDWSVSAPTLKTIEQAAHIRRKILTAFEAAEGEPDPERRRDWLTFVIVGAGSTGVELAGALGELARDTLPNDFRSIRTTDARIVLLDMAPRLLPDYAPDLGAKAERALSRLQVAFRGSTEVIGIDEDGVRIRSGETVSAIRARTVLWTAGVRASGLGGVLHERTGASLDRTGRVAVGPDCTLAGHPELFVIGDMARFVQDGVPLPAMAPVAMAQGRYVASLIGKRLDGVHDAGGFRYAYPGNLTVIGRNRAVADLGRWRFDGFAAWVLWLLIHLLYLVGFQNRILVAIQWAFHYFTFHRSARVIWGPAAAREGTDERRGRAA